MKALALALWALAWAAAPLGPAWAGEAAAHFPKAWRLWDRPLHLGGRPVGAARAGESLAATACLPGPRRTPMQCGRVPHRLWVRLRTRDGARWACIPGSWAPGHGALRTPRMEAPPPPPRTAPASRALQWKAKRAADLLWHPRPDAPVAVGVRPGAAFAVVGEEAGHWRLDNFGAPAYVPKDGADGAVGRSWTGWMLKLLSGGETWRTCLPFSLGPEPPLPRLCPADADGLFMAALDRDFDIADRRRHWDPRLPPPGAPCLTGPAPPAPP